MNNVHYIGYRIDTWGEYEYMPPLITITATIYKPHQYSPGNVRWYPISFSRLNPTRNFQSVEEAERYAQSYFKHYLGTFEWGYLGRITSPHSGILPLPYVPTRIRRGFWRIP